MIDTGGGGFSGSSGASTGPVSQSTTQSWGGRTMNYKSAGASAGGTLFDNPLVLVAVAAVVVAVMFVSRRK